MLQDPAAARSVRAYHRYMTLGDLAQVGREMNISHQRVSQLIARGEREGLFTRPHFARAPKIRKDVAQKALTENTSLQSAARDLRCSTKSLQYAIRFYGLDNAVADMEQRRRESRRERSAHRLRRDYERAVQVIGHHPTVSELREHGFATLYQRIISIHGGIFVFRAAHIAL